MQQMRLVATILGTFTMACSADVTELAIDSQSPEESLANEASESRMQSVLEEPADETIGSVSQALCTASARCPDARQFGFALGKWPNGRIYYEWAIPEPGEGWRETPVEDRTAILAAMSRWETASNHRIDFIEDKLQTAKLRFINAADFAFGTPGRNSFALCSNGCFVALGASNADHELGHGIGLGHAMSRNDRDHYIRMNTSIGDCADWSFARLSSSTVRGAGSGPFDFRSVMMYAPTDPDIQLWNQTPLCPSQPCAACAFGAGTPFFQPTPGDGSTVMELYSHDSWRPFARTVQSSGDTVPYDYDVASGVRIPSTADPAVETWEGGSLALYVRGVHQTSGENRIYKKYWDTGTQQWSAWSAFANPATGALSDPAVVSWAPGRIDMVVKQGSTIYIMTYANGQWGSWGAIGAPASTPASAPAITSWGANRLDVFVRGTDNKLYTKKCTANCNGSSGTWSSWFSLGAGTFKGRPAPVSRGSGLIDVFVAGMDDRLWAIGHSNGAWGDWYQVATSGTIKASPAAGARGTTLIDVHVRGLDDRHWITTWSGGPTWSPYSPLGGTLTSSPATVTKVRSTNRIDVAVVMGEERTLGDTRSGVWLKKYEP